ARRDKFDAQLVHPLQLTTGPDVWVGRIAWAELPGHAELEGGLRIVPVDARAGVENCLLHRLRGIDRDRETPLVDRVRDRTQRATRAHPEQLREDVVDPRAGGISVRMRGEERDPIA